MAPVNMLGQVVRAKSLEARLSDLIMNARQAWLNSMGIPDENHYLSIQWNFGSQAPFTSQAYSDRYPLPCDIADWKSEEFDRWRTLLDSNALSCEVAGTKPVDQWEDNSSSKSLQSRLTAEARDKLKQVIERKVEQLTGESDDASSIIDGSSTIFARWTWRFIGSSRLERLLTAEPSLDLIAFSDVILETLAKGLEAGSIRLIDQSTIEPLNAIPRMTEESVPPASSGRAAIRASKAGDVMDRSQPRKIENLMEITTLKSQTSQLKQDMNEREEEHEAEVQEFRDMQGELEIRFANLEWQMGIDSMCTFLAKPHYQCYATPEKLREIRRICEHWGRGPEELLPQFIDLLEEGAQLDDRSLKMIANFGQGYTIEKTLKFVRKAMDERMQRNLSETRFMTYEDLEKSWKKHRQQYGWTRYDIEEILDKKEKRGKTDYLIKWEGFEKPEWTHKECIPDIWVDAYEESLISKSKQVAPSTTSPSRKRGRSRKSLVVEEDFEDEDDEPLQKKSMSRRLSASRNSQG